MNCVQSLPHPKQRTLIRIPLRIRTPASWCASCARLDSTIVCLQDDDKVRSCDVRPSPCSALKREIVAGLRLRHRSLWRRLRLHASAFAVYELIRTLYFGCLRLRSSVKSERQTVQWSARLRQSIGNDWKRGDKQVINNYALRYIMRATLVRKDENISLISEMIINVQCKGVYMLRDSSHTQIN